MQRSDPVRVWVDASVSREVIGTGASLSFGKRQLSMGTYIKPGLTTVEAEIFALFHGIDLLRCLSAVTVAPKKHGVIFYTDSELTIKAIYELGRFRSRATKILIKNLVVTLDALIPDVVSDWSIQPVSSADNRADSVAKEARKRWVSRWMPRGSVRDSGPSSSTRSKSEDGQPELRGIL